MSQIPEYEILEQKAEEKLGKALGGETRIELIKAETR